LKCLGQAVRSEHGFIWLNTKQMTDALLKMIEKATDPDLKQGLGGASRL